MSWEPSPPPANDELVIDVDPRVPSSRPPGGPCPTNPAPPDGWKYWHAPVPIEASKLAVKMRDDPQTFPMGAFVQTRLNGQLVGVRVEWHTKKGATGQTGCFRGVNLMAPRALVPMGADLDRPHVYARPSRSGVAGAAPSGPQAGLQIRGIEVVQSVQNARHDVTLIAGKRTIVRVYVDPSSVQSAATVRGELVWRREGGEAYLPSINAVRLDPNSALDAFTQRSSLEHSLNFLLPASAIGAGTTKLKLNRIVVAGDGDVPLVPDDPATMKEVVFTRSAVLRVRAIGLRYKRQGGTESFTPDSIHFAYLRSFLLRAYPVAEIEWSQIVVDADFGAPFTGSTATRANAQLAAIRSQEVSAGIDPRTHYYGLVDDNQGRDFLRGLAFAIPDGPRPDTVACGPAGVPGGFAGDTDPSYADWYGAHELGHTFGRFHPGFPVGEQDASDQDFPYDGGLISPADAGYMGFDAGDPELGIPMRVLLGTTHHDIMTYAENQWISEYTFEAIHRRLLAEESLV